MTRSNDVIFIQSPTDVNELEVPAKDYKKLVGIASDSDIPFLYNPLNSKIFFIRTMDYEEWYDIDSVMRGTF